MKRSRGLFFLALFLLTSGCSLLHSGKSAETYSYPLKASFSKDASKGDLRGLWVTRWDFRSADDVKRIISDASLLGTTDLFFQVRGQADAYYRSELEPWGEDLLAGVRNGKEPSFDPLQVACEEAHQRGIRLHAWFNVMPLWREKIPPESTKHVYHVHPEWRLRDSKGNYQPLNEHYVMINPLREDVRRHLRNVVRDIVNRYPVDGLHLDYIRFIPQTGEDGNYLYDNETRNLFRRETGLEAVTHKAEFSRFIAEHITEIVRDLRRVVRARNKNIIFSAAVWRDPETARRDYLQDYASWMERGLLDMAVPMLYTTDDRRFSRELQTVIDVAGETPVLAGIGAYKHTTAEQLQMQLEITRELPAAGYSLFGYESFFRSANPQQDHSPRASGIRRLRRRVVQEWVATGKDHP